MRFSRNPKTGILECYTDTGIFVGNMAGMGDMTSDKKQAKDAEVWRTTEEGHHIKLESGTGEIKAGFGGKHKGETLKEAFGGGQSAKKPAAAKPKRIRPESTAKMVSSVAGEKNLINDPDFEAARTKWADAMKRKDAASKRFLEIGRELKNEIKYPDDDAKSMGPQYAGLFGWYTEKGKQLKKEYDDCFAETKKAGQEAEEYGGKMDELKRQKRSEEIAEWGNPELKETTRKDFEGFTLESDVPALREKLKNGSAKVVEMSPKEYLERCAFEIFTDSTLENTVAGTESHKVNKYADLMENGEKFPIPYLDYATNNQEGRHRALAAMMNGYETMPVAIIGKEVGAGMREEPATYNPDPDPGEIESLKKRISGLSRFGEQGKLRKELTAKLESLTAKPEEPAKQSKKPDRPAVPLEETEDPGHPVTPYKEKQFEIVNAANPMHDDIHTGIRKPSDIMSPEEAFSNPEDYVYPDFTPEDGRKALESGVITLYSSYPIENGVFVTPSKMMAGDYAGEGQVYSKTVPVEDVAWINAGEGQFAQVSGEVPTLKEPTESFVEPDVNDPDFDFIKDEDVWRTSEEGKHFKFDNATGEIKAGFGGKFNGEKLGSVFKNSAAGRKQAAAAPKTVETPKAPAAPSKPSGVQITPKQSKTLGQVSKRIRNLKNEQSFIIGPDGEIRASAKGDRHSVPMTVGTKREHLGGAISLHNHPQGGTFSADDLRDFAYGATEIHVSGPDGDYCLKNLKYDTPERYNGWLDMQEALKKSVPETVSSLDLMKQADANLKGNETRRKLEEIAQTWVKMKNAGASNEILQAYFDESGYDELSKKAAQERKDEIRRLETEPFHEFYRQHAAEYGFEYTFEPKEEGGRRKKEARQRQSQEAQNGVEETKIDYRDTPTMKTYDEYLPVYRDTYDNYIQEVRSGYASTSPEQAAAIDTYVKRTPEYERILKTALEKHDFSSKTDEDSIIGILQDGKMKSQIETGRTHGLDDVQMRKSLADNLFNGGDKLEIGDDQYELYGYLDHAERANIYGDCRIVLKKDQVKARTTITVGDSLQQFSLGNSQVPTLATDPKIYSLMMQPFSGPMLPKYILEQAERKFTEIAKSGKIADSYVELQFHGGVKTSDIEYIEVPKTARNRARIKSLAKQQGVEIRWTDI